MHRLVALFHAPQSYMLAISRKRVVGLTLLWPVISYKPHQCDQYLCHQNASIDSLIPLVPLHETFHP